MSGSFSRIDVRWIGSARRNGARRSGGARGTRGARGSRGVVLLSVLLVLALLAALAWQLVGAHSLLIAQARFSYTADQALQYALGAEAFARQVLYDEWQSGGAQKDTLLEVWARPTPPFEVDNGFLEVQIRDLHDCFNLNSLVGSDAERNVARLKNLLRDRNLPDAVADAWRDWIDPDQEITGFGAEDGDYLLEEPPYRTANTLAADLSELRLVRGVEPEAFDLLEGLLCVLPDPRLQINVNTASAGVLAALSEAATEPQLMPFVESERDYDDPATVVADFPELADAVDALTVTSEYFQVNVRAQVDDIQTELSSLLHRDPASGAIRLISRNFGRDFRSLFAADEESQDAG